MSVKIDQALVNTFIGASFGLPIAHENKGYTPTSDAYAELLVLQNDTTALSLAHSNETDGIFRVILRYPIGTGAVVVKQKTDEIFAVFKIGARPAYDGQDLVIKTNQRQPSNVDDGWFKIVLTMGYTALINR